MAAVQAIIAARAATAALSSEQTDRNQREFEERFEESERLQAEVSFKWNAGRPKPSDYSPGSLKARYVAMSNQLHIKVTSTEKFELFFQACIGVMCVLMGLETYDSMEANPTLELLMLILICFFAMEVFLKLFAEGTKPWRYFCGPDGRWNTLDLLIVILSIPMLPVGESGRVLRMIRLLRLVKIISKMDSFRVFVCGIEEATGDIINISSLIGLVLYMYSVAGMVLLGENDPWHFGSLHRSFITLFAMATMDGWAGILYKNAYGCAAYYEGEGMAEEMAEDIQMKCAGNVTAPITTAIFCLSFVTITGLVMLSMFIGVISIAMSETIVKVRKEKKHEMQRKVMKRKAEKILEAKREAASPETQGQNTKTSMQDVDEYNQQQKLIGQTKMLFMGDSTKPVYMEQTTAFGQQLQKLAKVCKKLVESDKFVFFVFALIIAGGLLVAMKMYFREQLTGITDVVGQLMTIVFTIEMILKILSEGGTPLHYIYKDCEFQNWNILDAFVVICNYTSIKTDLLMVLRMVLVLKLMKMHPYLRVSVQSFLASIGATGVIGCLMGIVFFFFAIVGVVLFKKNDPAHFQNLHIAMLTLFRVATLDDWVDVMNTNLYGCEIFTDEAIPAKFRECDVEASKHAASIGIVAVIYFLIFIIVGTFVMLNLFIGVIMIEMEATMSQLESERDVDMRAKALGKKHQYGRKELTDLREMVSNNNKCCANGK
jgi:voltage-gated sodium channel